MVTPSEQAGIPDAVLNSISIQEFRAVLAANGYVDQLLNGPDGGPVVRYFKLDIDVLARFLKPAADGKFAILVLNSYFKGSAPLAALNQLNAMGLLPKFYVNDDHTVVELCLPAESGWGAAAFGYYVRTFEETLRAFVQKRLLPG